MLRLLASTVRVRARLEPLRALDRAEVHILCAPAQSDRGAVGIEGHVAHRVEYPRRRSAGALDLEQLDFSGDALQGTTTYGRHLDVTACSELVAQRVGDEELVLRRAGDAGGDVHGGPDVVTIPVQQRSVVRADADRGELVLATHVGLDVQATLHRLGSVGDGKHELVADLLDDLAATTCGGVAYQFREPLDHPSGGVVAHRL